MEPPAIDPKLMHLNEAQITELVSRYFSGESITVLLREFNIDCQAGRLYKLLPPTVYPLEPCPNCGGLLIQPRSSRSASQYVSSMAKHCSRCEHHERWYCDCCFCNQRRVREAEAIEALNREVVDAFLNNQPQARNIDIDDMTLEHAVSLLSLVRSCGYLDGADGELVLNPLGSCGVPFAPNGTCGELFFSRIRDAGLVAVSRYSPAEAFSVVSGNGVVCNRGRLRWEIAARFPFELISNIEQCAMTGNWPGSWLEQVPEMVSALALAECKEYFEYAAEERGLPSPGEKSSLSMLQNLLEDFSVCQSYRIIDAGAKWAADFYVRKSCTRSHAANYMIGACQRWADRARAEGWVVGAYRRNFNLPRSMLSYVLHDLFLKTAEDGFNLPLKQVC